jgi:DNA primase
MLTINETWDSIINQIGSKALRRGRGQCPLCESSTGFSANDNRGFHCFACGAHGDKIGFVQQFCKCDFKAALRFFGLEPGRPPIPDPETERRRKIRQGLEAWARAQRKELSAAHYGREQLSTLALHRLRQDPEDAAGWDWLTKALPGLPGIEYQLDLLSGTEEEQIELYKHLRTA